MRLKTYLSVCLGMIMPCLFYTNAMAQFGIRAGVNSYNVLSRDAYDNELYRDTRFTSGFNAGISYDFRIAKNLFIQPAALITRKGYWLKNIEETSSDEYWITPYYIEMPINVLFKPKLGSGRLLLGAGPYISYGVGGKGHYIGKTVVDGELITVKQNAKLDFVKDVNDLEEGKWAYAKPLDYGVQMVQGYELHNGFSLQLYGQIGIADIYPDVDGKVSANSLFNYGFSLSVGYRF